MALSVIPLSNLCGLTCPDILRDTGHPSAHPCCQALQRLQGGPVVSGLLTMCDFSFVSHSGPGEKQLD